MHPDLAVETACFLAIKSNLRYGTTRNIVGTYQIADVPKGDKLHDKLYKIPPMEYALFNIQVWTIQTTSYTIRIPYVDCLAESLDSPFYQNMIRIRALFSHATVYLFFI